MFSGSYQLTVDDKGRVAIPTRLRQQLADEFGTTIYVTKADKPCLEIHPSRGFREIAEQIQEMEDQELAEALKLMYIGRAVESDIDRQGRVTLPPMLRQDAKLSGKVMLVGMGKRLDVWADSEYQTEVSAREVDLKSALARIKR